jgi:glycosyltransferase involved in cell wall biosynthesis
MTSVNTPRVSVVTPSFNQGNYIEKTILSVLRQNYSNIQYILFDAISKDNTKNVLERYRHEFDVLKIEPDEGQVDALNKGFDLADGDIIAYLNADDCYANDNVISQVVQLFEEHPEVSVIYGRRIVIDDHGFYINEPPYREFCKSLLYWADYIPQECVFWRRSIFEKAGFKVDKTFSFAMDYELWLRFLEHDAQFLSVDQVFGLFRWYSDQKSQSQWQTHGLPEIERLHRKYLGHSVPESKMMGYYHEHYYQANPDHNKDLFDFYHHFWEVTMWHKRELLSHRPLDEWSYYRNPS